MQRLIAIGMAMASVSAGCALTNSQANPQPAPAGPISEQARVPGEYLVTVAPPGEAKAVSEVFGRFGIKSIRSIAPNLFLVALAEDPGPETMEKLRKGDSRIRAVEPNFVHRIQEKP